MKTEADAHAENKAPGVGAGGEVGGEVTRWREGDKMEQTGKKPGAVSCEQSLQ